MCVCLYASGCVNGCALVQAVVLCYQMSLMIEIRRHALLVITIITIADVIAIAITVLLERHLSIYLSICLSVCLFVFVSESLSHLIVVIIGVVVVTFSSHHHHHHESNCASIVMTTVSHSFVIPSKTGNYSAIIGSMDVSICQSLCTNLTSFRVVGSWTQVVFISEFINGN